MFLTAFRTRRRLLFLSNVFNTSVFFNSCDMHETCFSWVLSIEAHLFPMGLLNTWWRCSASFIIYTERFAVVGVWQLVDLLVSLLSGLNLDFTVRRSASLHAWLGVFLVFVLKMLCLVQGLTCSHEQYSCSPDTFQFYVNMSAPTFFEVFIVLQFQVRGTEDLLYLLYIRA